MNCAAKVRIKNKTAKRFAIFVVFLRQLYTILTQEVNTINKIMTPPDIIYSDIALQYLFRIFSLFRVFSQSHSYAEMILYREKPRKTQTYAENYLTQKAQKAQKSSLRTRISRISRISDIAPAIFLAITYYFDPKTNAENVVF